MPRLLVHFARFGAYHRARLRAAAEALAPHGWEVLGLEIASTDSTYAWAEVVHTTERDIGEPRVITAFPGRVYEQITAAEYRRVLHPLLDGLAPDAMAIAGWGSVDAGSCLWWCRRHEVRRIVMSETRHADGRRVWWKEFLKSRIVRRFDAALVGGKSHRDYLVKLGMRADKIRFGYNVVDNGYFAEEADRWREAEGGRQGSGDRGQGPEMSAVAGGLTRGETPRETAWRETRQPLSAICDQQSTICDPRSTIHPYFLASNRFIERKNLARLIEAYAGYIQQAPISSLRSPIWDLCLLGDGELKGALIAQCEALGLRVVEGAPWETGEKVGSDGLGRTLTAPEGEMQLEGKCSGDSLASTVTDRRYSADHVPQTACRMPHAACPKPPFVFFPGFRQIEELPRFYAHAGAFVHPALEEPWGLVINEALACGLPVLSSRNVGAAEELVLEGVNGLTFEPNDASDILRCLRRLAELTAGERHAMQRLSSQTLAERCPVEIFGRSLAALLTL